jgi:hypothetical protein
MLLWGVAQPFAGALADRFGAAPLPKGGSFLNHGLISVGVSVVATT